MFLVILLLPRPDFTSRLLNGFKPMGIQALLPQICRIMLTLKPINEVVRSMTYLIAALQRRGVMRVSLGVGFFVFLHGKLRLLVANALQNNGGTELKAFSV